MTHDGQPRQADPRNDLDGLDELDEFDRLAEEAEGETVVVDRGAPADGFVGETVAVDRSAPDDHLVDETVVVDRSPAAGLADGLAVTDLDAPTTVVNRSATDDSFADQDTFISGRRPDDGDGSDATGHDDTVVVDRGSAAEPSLPEASVNPDAPVNPDASVSAEASVTVDAPVRRRRLGSRRTLEPAPLEPIDLRSSVRAVGAGAVEYYRPRQLPEASPAPSAFDAAPPAREPTPDLPSVRRSSRRVAVITLSALTAAAAVGVVGALAVAGLLIGG
jgi:hypothetical protein